MSEPTERNLHLARKIVLVRVHNGWVVSNENISCTERNDQFAFESTESLQRQLVRLLGQSGWKIETPERDEKGHFKPKRQPKAATSTPDAKP